MSIKTTKHVSRSWAIERINLVYMLAIQKKYRTLEHNSFEPQVDIEDFINEFDVDISNIEEWTNRMIERRLDSPFFRESNSDNYLIEE